MFGLLRPDVQSAQYRHAYAQVCRQHHTLYGRLSTLFHSYEAVLLYLIATDLGRLPAIPSACETCCRLLRKASRPSAVCNAEPAVFATNVSLLLAWVKLEDDIRDTRSLPARIALGLLRGSVEKMFAYFDTLDAGFEQKLKTILGRHYKLEASEATPCRLDDFCDPTKEAFSYVFSLFARVLGGRDDLGWLQEVGKEVGYATVAFDAATDFAVDVRRKTFTPLASQDDAVYAARRAKLAISKAAEHCESRCPGGMAAATLRSVNDSLVIGDHGRQPGTVSLLQKCSPLRVQKRGYAFSDCSGLICGCIVMFFCATSCLQGGGGGGRGGHRRIEIHKRRDGYGGWKKTVTKHDC